MCQVVSQCHRWHCVTAMIINIVDGAEMSVEGRAKGENSLAEAYGEIN